MWSRFAIVVSYIGLALTSALAVATYAAPKSVEDPWFVYVPFIGVFFAFIPAVGGHPAREQSGGEVSVSTEAVWKSAPKWTFALEAAFLALTLYCFATGVAPDEHGRRSFTIDRASLLDHPERTRTCEAFFGLFYAISLQIALSAQRLRGERGLPWDL